MISTHNTTFTCTSSYLLLFYVCVHVYMYSTLTTDIGLSHTSTVLSGKALADSPTITAGSAAAAGGGGGGGGVGGGGGGVGGGVAAVAAVAAAAATGAGVDYTK